MKIFFKFFILICTFSFFFTACSKDSSPNDTPQISRTIKFEITGNYSGSLRVAYTNVSGGVESSVITALPWTKEITYATTIAGIGFGGDSEPSPLGVSGQSVTVKILSNGNLVIPASTTSANANGTINLPNLTYIFR